MKNRYLYIVAAALFVAGCTADFNESVVVDDTADYSKKIINRSDSAAEGCLVVRFTEEAESRLETRAAIPGATRTGIADVDAILDRVNASSVEQVFIVNDMTREKVMAEGMHLWYELKFDKEASLDEVAVELAKVGEVERVQFSRRTVRIEQPVAATATTSSQPASPASRATTSSDFPFNDPYKDYLWNLDNLGINSRVGYTSGYTKLSEPNIYADVNAIPAWELCTGDPSIVVAVVDEGVMYTHEDLRTNYFVNSVERNGKAGVDDDGNGYIDDTYGYNFVDNSPTISWEVEGDSGHGTHVAGIVSATNNNKIGISSIAGGSGNKDGVKIFSVQIFDGNEGGYSVSTARAMQYCAIRGAHIMQCSWGYDSGSVKNDTIYTSDYSVESDAIDYFVKYGGTPDGPLEGGLAIFAAGNDSKSLPSYPSAYEPCISVSSIGPALKPAYYTNYGIGTDIGAPGGETIYSNGGILSCVPAKIATAEDSAFTNYLFYQGTSMACPMVSGVAALGLSYAKQLGKRYTAAEYKSLLLSATNDFDPYFTGTLTLRYTNGQQIVFDYPTYKGKMGAGYVDAHKLLLKIDGTPYVTVQTGKTFEIDLSTYFGDGVGYMGYKGTKVDVEEAAALGLVVSGVSGGKLVGSCSRSGCTTVTVTMLQGGNNNNNEDYPFSTEVSRTFVIMVKDALSSNNGWL